MSFKERQEEQRRAKREKKRSKERCYICKQLGHTRKQCPGIEDGGKGQSVHRNTTGFKKKTKNGERGSSKVSDHT